MNGSENLLARVVAGDQEAWREVVAQYQRLVYSILRRHRIPPGDDEDLFQETFLRLYRNAHRVREPAALARWISVTARNLCLDHIGRMERSPVIDTDLPETAADVDIEGDQERLQTAQEVREAVATLSERCRRLLWALYFESDALDYSSVSEQLEMPVGSIGPTRARCLERLLHEMKRRRAATGESP